jgi:hypothetical protein
MFQVSFFMFECMIRRMRFHEVLLYRVPTITGYDLLKTLFREDPRVHVATHCALNMSSVDRLFDKTKTKLQNIILNFDTLWICKLKINLPDRRKQGTADKKIIFNRSVSRTVQLSMNCSIS